MWVELSPCSVLAKKDGVVETFVVFEMTLPVSKNSLDYTCLFNVKSHYSFLIDMWQLFQGCAKLALCEDLTV